jgi:hypothetical protein
MFGISAEKMAHGPLVKMPIWFLLFRIHWILIEKCYKVKNLSAEVCWAENGLSAQGLSRFLRQLGVSTLPS